MNSTNTKLTLYGGDEWWTLEERACQGLESARKGGRVGKSRMQAENADILLTWKRRILVLKVGQRESDGVPAPC